MQEIATIAQTKKDKKSVVVKKSAKDEKNNAE